MTDPIETPTAKKATVIKKMLTLSAPWRIFLLCMLLISILFYQLHLPLTSQVATANEVTEYTAPSLPTPPSITPKPAANLVATPSIWPVRGTITSGFGWRISPFGDGNELHPGVDIAYTMGAPVVATADGEVVASGPAGGYGNLVQIDHGNGIATLYGHNSQLAVNVGQQVKKGQVIAYAGSTGKSTGPHVHYEVRINNTPIDPMKYLVSY
ncbi:M23 family metallopeptidase [Pelosinus sp. UFO1]|uniref:M23 family metallopeptidase n=1 Tax=Pelosinus sp. UFO1 TaxID=484770 RepID=UPI0004D1568C|nr:M23 family metallopeptidase [Pelosinus sp. UFO1]AIF51869.1 Peptidase M23 [Pelosinus sp. UFO1]